VIRKASFLLMFCALTVAPAPAAEQDLTEQVRLLREQNALLQQQVQKQDKVLDTLQSKIQKLEKQSDAHAVAEVEK
jgi:phage shock protein A